jgi:hypothetical protein
MPVEDLRNLLDELIHVKPQGALARELCADASKKDDLIPPDHSLLYHLHPATSSADSWTSHHTNHSAESGRGNGSHRVTRRSDQTVGHSSGNGSGLSHQQRQQQQQLRQSEQNGLNSQSLQDLVSMECNSSSGKAGRKNSSRANSFTEDGQNRGSGSRAAATATSGTSKNMRTKSGAVPSGSSSNSNHNNNNKKAHPCNKNLSSSSSPAAVTSSSSGMSAHPSQSSSPSSSSMPSHANASSSTATSDPQQDLLSHHYTPKDGSNHRPNSSSNYNNNNYDCDVESGRSDASSQLFTPSPITYSKNNSHSSSSSIKHQFSGRSQPQPPPGAHPVHVCREENLMEELENAVELQDLRKQANIVSINSLNGGRPAAPGHEVDSVVQFSKLDSRSTIDPQYAELIHRNPQNYASSKTSGKTGVRSLL